MTPIACLRAAMARRLGCFVADRSATTAVEYGLMVALIALAIMATVFSMGQGIKDTLYGAITNALAALL
jgi:Flp pilus assembly pilin Flp